MQHTYVAAIGALIEDFNDVAALALSGIFSRVGFLSLQSKIFPMGL